MDVFKKRKKFGSDRVKLTLSGENVFRLAGEILLDDN